MHLRKNILMISFSLGICFALNFLIQSFHKNSFSKQSFANPMKKDSKNPVSQCYRDVYAEPIKIWSIKHEGNTFYQITARRKKYTNKSITEILYFRTNTYRCDFLNQNSPFESRLAFMPKTVAVKFAEQWYKPYFDKCLKSKTNTTQAKQLCIKVFEDDFNIPPNTKQESPQFIFTEDAIALNKLGIRTDKALVVDTYADFRKYMTKYGWPSVEPKK